jgi:hypothetical protein
MPLLEVASERGDRIGMGLVKGSNCSHPLLIDRGGLY